MKKIIPILLILNLISCRSVKKEVTKNTSKTEQTAVVNAQSEQTGQTTITENKAEQSKAEQTAVLETETKQVAQSETEHTAAKNSVENQARNKTKTKRRKEYFPDGAIKSETETTEMESEIVSRQQQEIDYLKASVVALKEEKALLEEDLKTEQQKTEKLEQQNEEWRKASQELIYKYADAKHELNKNVKREFNFGSLALSALLVIALYECGKRLLNKYIKSWQR